MKKISILLIFIFSYTSISASGYKPERFKTTQNGYGLVIHSADTLLYKGNTSRYSVSNLIDGNLSTVWVTKFDSSASAQEKEQLKIVFDKPVYLRNIKIANGYQRNASIYNENHRVKILNLEKIYVGGRNYPLQEKYNLADNSKLQTITFLPKTFMVMDLFMVKEIILNIDDVYPGSKYSDLCISEIAFNLSNTSGYLPKYEWKALREIIITNRVGDDSSWDWETIHTSTEPYFEDLVHYVLLGNNDALSMFMSLKPASISASEAMTNMYIPAVKEQLGI